jgi:predicted pyridoxine 5'-phosphate oxidase superfamily flavin-nucleotide-binding protein
MGYSSDIAFTSSVKQVQRRKGSRANYARMEESGSWQTRITADLKTFIESQTSVFLATANAQGQPYIQHRGGPPGFLQVRDEETIAFVDYVGNRQYITLGKLAENSQAQLFLIDYRHRRRVKIWGEARVIEDDPGLTQKLTPGGAKGRPSQVIELRVRAWDANCPQHIPRRFEEAEVAAMVAERDLRIADLERQILQLRKPTAGGASSLDPPGQG